MNVSEIYYVSAHRATGFLLIDTMKLLFEIAESKKQNEGKHEKQFERQYQEGDAKRYKCQGCHHKQ
jgi:hypothetical protein